MIDYRAGSSAYVFNATLGLAHPPGTVAGDMMLAGINLRSGNTVTAVPAGWTLLHTATQSDPGPTWLVYWKIATDSEPGTHSWTMSAAQHYSGVLVAFSGSFDATSVAAHAVSDITATNVLTKTAPTVTPSAAGMLLLLGGQRDATAGGTTWTLPAGFTARQAQSQDFTNVAAFTKALTAAGATGTTDLTQNQSGRMVASAVALTEKTAAGPFLADDFATQDTAKWTYTNTATVAAGRLSLTPNGYSTAGDQIASTALYDLTNGSVSLSVEGITNATTSGEAYLTVELVADDGTTGLRWLVYQFGADAPTAQSDYRTAGGTWDLDYNTEIPRQKYLRIRHAAPSILWEQSPTGLDGSWTTLRSVLTSSIGPITSLRVRLRAEGVGTGPYLLDNVLGTAATSAAVPPVTTAGRVRANIGGTWAGKPVKVNVAGTWVEKPARTFRNGLWFKTGESTAGKPPAGDIAAGSRLPETVVGTYWFHISGLRLNTVNAGYNVVWVAFADPTGALDGSVYFDANARPNKATFKADMAELRARPNPPKIILSSFGGPQNRQVVNSDATADRFAADIIAICQDYGFDGFDWDLEHAPDFTGPAMARASRAIVAAMRASNPNFALTVAVHLGSSMTDFAWNDNGRKYAEMVRSCTDIIDMVQPQYYNRDNRVYDVNYMRSEVQGWLNQGLRQDQVGLLWMIQPSAIQVSDTQLVTVAYVNSTWTNLTNTWPGLRGVGMWSMTLDQANGNTFVNTVGPHVLSTP